MNYIKTGIEKVKEVKTYWKKPSEGNYMSFREIFAYSVGGFGAYSIFTMAQALLLSTTNVIIGNTIGIQPMHMYVMYLISVITNIPLTMVRANMVDNVKYKEGKYRPYLLRMGIPTVAISMLFVFTPYTRVPYLVRCVLIFVYNFGLQFFYNFFYDAYENLIHVLSPNSQERTNVTAIKSMIYSLSPTVTNFITPLIASKVADGNMYDLRVYRWLYPFIAVIGVAMIVLVYSRTEEKIVIARTHKMKIKFTDALREVAKNKYFWIISLAGWLGFLETCTYVILQWLYNYAHLCTPEQYAFITLIRGTAYTWGMVLAPFAIKRWGKKKVLIVTNLFNIAFLALVYPLMGSIWTVLMCMYMNSVADSFILVLNPAIQADIRDYQQYKSGERIDGMFGAVAMIGSFVTMATSSVLPAVYEKYGIYSGNGYENMYDVLYNPDILYKLVGVLVILSAVGAALNVIPYFFYDLTETKQKAIIRILKIRAMFEDYGNGVLTDDDMKSTMELIRSSKDRAENSQIIDIKALKAQGASKQELKQARADNEEYEMSVAVVEELMRFTTPEGLARLEWAKKIAAGGIENIASLSYDDVTAAKALPSGNHRERAIRKETVADAKLGMRSKKACLKFYPDGIKDFDIQHLHDLEKEENEVEEKKAMLLKQKADAKEIEALTERLRVLHAEIKAQTEEYQHFAAATMVYTEAKKYITQAENYARFGELDSKYNASLADSDSEEAE
ncbi:MAG: MFS transporter [Clostridia bacterium]|nr:MFS transporter [Clostridia bacterium]